MMLRRHLAVWGSSLRNLVYPPQCLACRGELEEFARARFCTPCLTELAVFTGTLCQRCGAPHASELPMRVGCPHCHHLKFRFDTALALGEYDGTLRDLVLATKRRTGEPLAMGLAHLLADSREQQFRGGEFDVVTSVPMHWRRRLARQACGPDLMGEVLARWLGLPYARSLVRRRRSTTPQFELPVSRRGVNVRAAFTLGKGHSLNQAHVLLVDDILTTGSTCSEIARVLKRSGAARVTVAVLARSFAGS